jgi:hypothetical protein
MSGPAEKRELRLFINYRVEDTGPTASRLFDELERCYGANRVFIDHRSIEGGEKWPERLEKEVKRATVMLVLVGERWLKIQDAETFERRLSLPEDWVRKEIETALVSHLTTLVIVLVDEAQPVKAQVLRTVPSLVPLADLQAVRLRRRDWPHDIAQLRSLLLKHGFESTGSNESGVHEAQSGNSVIIDMGRLPETRYKNLVGRGVELSQLDDAWFDNSINIVSLVAFGGMGKTALVNEWLLRIQKDNYREGQAILVWTFYSQGSEERAGSSEPFIRWALETLGVAPSSTSVTAGAERLAAALASKRSLIVLDGVEPLLYGPGTEEGRLKDKGLRVLLQRIAALPPAAEHGLVLITTRLAIRDLERWNKSAAPVIPLSPLKEKAGAILLSEIAWTRPVVGEGVTSCPRAGCGKSACPVQMACEGRIEI